MLKLLLLAAFIATIWAASDVLKTFHKLPPRLYWFAIVIGLPIAGPALWYYCQYAWPRRDRLEAEGRKKRRDVKEESSEQIR